MKQWTVTWGLALALVLAQGVWSEAAAGPRPTIKTRTPSRSVARSAPSVRSNIRSGARAGHRFRTSPNRASSPSTNRFNGGDRATASGALGQALGSALAGRANGLGSGYNGRGAYGSGGYGDILSELGRYIDYAQRDRRHRSHEDQRYRAQRDALIADAVVQVVGMVTSARRQPRAYVPAPPVHEIRQVLVEEGHYERYQVYIEPVYDRHTGEKMDGGYHETRTRWVPPRYEERMVLVQR